MQGGSANISQPAARQSGAADTSTMPETEERRQFIWNRARCVAFAGIVRRNGTFVRFQLPIVYSPVRGIRDAILLIVGRSTTVKALVLSEPDFKAPFWSWSRFLTKNRVHFSGSALAIHLTPRETPSCPVHASIASPADRATAWKA